MILDDLTVAVAKRLVTDKQQVPPEVMKQRALAAPKKEGFPFERNLKKPGLSFICEVKKASPSKGSSLPISLTSPLPKNMNRPAPQPFPS